MAVTSYSLFSFICYYSVSHSFLPEVQSEIKGLEDRMCVDSSVEGIWFTKERNNFMGEKQYMRRRN